MPLPQRIAAIPSYVRSEAATPFVDAAPGHRFMGYLRNTQGADGELFAAYKGKARLIGNPAQGAEKRAANEALKNENDAVLNEVCKLGESAKKQIEAIRKRQQILTSQYGTNVFTVKTQSTAPFATGLGNEHPIENGFAFLTPYGLPYLAGSGVKGILRRAAEELALENDTQGTGGWTWLAIWFLFGFEGAVDKGSLWDESSQLGKAFLRDVKGMAESPEIYALIRRLFDKDKKAGVRFLDVESRGAEQFLQACMADKSLRGGLQCRGALDFWDVFPKPFGDKLVVEIMTPHFGSYYQGKSTPHDSGAPIPVSFLAVPAKSDFDFHVVCHPSRLPESLQNTWRDLLQKAFDHAFEWVGFGAKTSVGYGAMKAAASGSSSSVLSTSGSFGLNVQPAIGGAIANGLQTWPAATLKLNPGKNEITASFEGKTTAPVKGSDADKLRVALGEERAGRLKKKQELKGVSVEVEQQGNAFTLKGLAAT